MAADGGHASIENLREAKALLVEEMASSPEVYRKLRYFRAGIEAGISRLKRAYGMGHCTWKGWAHFRAYVWSSVVAHNLALFWAIGIGLTAKRKPTSAGTRIPKGGHAQTMGFLRVTDLS